MSELFKISSDAQILLKDLLPGIDSKINQAAVIYKQLATDDGAIKELTNAFFMQWTLSSDYDSIEKLRSKDADMNWLYIYARFLARACILAYLGEFDNDKNLNKLRESKENAIVKDILNKKEKSSDNQNKEITLTDDEKLKAQTEANLAFEFGYKGLTDSVLSCIESVECDDSYISLVDGRVESNLLSSLRDIDVQEYLKGGYIEKDIKLIALMGNKTDEELVQDILDMIKSSDTYNGAISETVENIIVTYKYFFQDSFGLRPYAGILSYSSPFSKCITESNYLGTISGAKANFENISSYLRKHLNAEEQYDRQFNIDKIIESNGKVPLYFPNKILEYAMGRELTYNLTENVYKRHSCSDSWETYCDSYVRKQIERCVIETIYKSIELNFDVKNLSWLTIVESDKDKPFKFNSDSFRYCYDSSNFKYKDSLEEYITDTSFTKVVGENLDKLTKSLCTAVAIVKYNNVGGKANSICIRIIDTMDALNVDMTHDMFCSLTRNKKVHFENGDIISDGKTNSMGDELPFRIFEFRHDFDSALANAEPLFGYTAVDLYLAQKKPMGWDRILLGEDTKGTPLFASIIDKDDIPMQSCNVHNVMAGSRSGKGVMTMNIIASAVASEKPIFYIDRKPDMAVMFYTLTNGNMFIVNGGQYLPKNDPNNDWGDEGKAINGWRNAYKALPNYLTDSANGIFKNETYAGAFGDFVYYRACMLVFAILMARLYGANNPSIYNQLGGTKGIVAVFDEFKNWQENFEASYFEVNGIFAKSENRLTSKDLEMYKKTLNDIKAKETQLSIIKDDPKKTAQVTKIKSDIDMLKDTMKETYTPLRVYCSTVISKFGESIKYMSEAFAAGFKDGEGKLSDIFVIGQHIDIDEYYAPSSPTGVYTQTSSGAFNNSKETQNKSLMRGLLNHFPYVDWFMGLNNEVKDKYMGATEESGSTAYKWITKRRYWGYVPAGTTMESLRTSAPSNVTYFNPYLVLNNNKEDDPNNRKMITVPTEDGSSTEEVLNEQYNFVGQCRDRVNSAVPNLWEKVRLKHLGQNKEENEAILKDMQLTGNKHYDDELNKGIGFEGLARKTKKAAYVGKVAHGENPNFSQDLDVNKDFGESKKIADFVAKKLGYTSYQEYLFDFSPKGIFSVKDMTDCILGTASPENLHARLPLFFTYNVFNTEDQETDMQVESHSTNRKSTLDEIDFLEKQIQQQQDKSVEVTDIEVDNSIIEYNPPLSDEMSDEEAQKQLNKLLGNSSMQLDTNIQDNNTNDIRIVSKVEMIGTLTSLLFDIVMNECAKKGINTVEESGREKAMQVVDALIEDTQCLCLLKNIYEDNIPNTEVRLNE